ncbi:SNF2 family N-terminal domain-containing protein [Xylariaceae sp. FL0255]|nr:SNF2 family N-terminal domain-containing protein [Xylariaceae sp. FL0255]
MPHLHEKRAREPDYFLDDDELADDDFAELVIPSSSPYFTQPTQVLKHTTQPTQLINRPIQPTQIVNPPAQDAAHTTQPTQIVHCSTQPTQITGRTSLRPSKHSPSPTSIVEVPASSPFQIKPPSAFSPLSRQKQSVSRPVGSLMAPAGTMFRPPAARALASPTKIGTKRKTYLEISDDDLSQDYRHDDSSADESPMRGDIKPSSFTRKDPLPQASESKPKWMLKSDIQLNDIHDIRLRTLTKQVYRAVSNSKRGVTIKECRDVLMNNVAFQVTEAVNYLLDKTAASSSANLSTSSNPRYGNKQDGASSRANFKQSSHLTATRNVLTSTTSALSSASSTSSSGLSKLNENAQAPGKRRRLVQGRKHKSPTPPPVFSIPSSASSQPTTPPQSSPEQQAPIPKSKDRINDKVKAKPPKPRRRLLRGRRQPSPPSQLINLASDSESNSDSPPPRKTISTKRRAEETLGPETLDLCSGTESDDGTSTTLADPLSPVQEEVLKYLNECSAESLAQISGFTMADSELMKSACPFHSIADAENVSKKDKAKSKARAKRLEIGSLFVDKLTSWFTALNAVGEVIVECKERGQILETTMKDWSMDRNGRPRDGAELPISGKPKSMAEDLTLKSYQLLGLNWMSLLHSQGYSGILADDMGLGKTCQVISMCAHLVDSYDENTGEPRPWPILIVVPPSVCENWIAEFERFAPNLTIEPYLGKDRRNIDPEAARENHIILTSYSQVERQAEDLRWLRELTPYAAIFDEGHKLKNRKNLVYKQMMRVPTQWRLILSGTPVQNNLRELLTLLHFIEPDLFSGAFEELDALFESKVPNREIHNYTALARERVSNARAIMAPFILQRRKDDVLDLAKKTERNIMLEMHPKQKEIYDELKSRCRAPQNKRASSTIKNSNSWTQLRQVAIHHQLFRVHFTDKAVNEMVDILWKKCTEEELMVQSKADRHKALFIKDYMDKSDFQLHLECKHFKKYIGRFDIPHRSWEESPKIQKLLKLVRTYMKKGDRVLVFSRFDLVINILRETLSSVDIPYCELTGSTDMADRFPEIERFNENPDIPVFLLTTGAGGTGLNLTAANKIIIFDQSDNPQDDVQASNRAHRIGQTREVEVIRFITKGTVEPLIFNSCVKKLMLARCVEGDVPVDDEVENESVEQQCRKLMLLEEEDEGEKVLE